MVIIALYLTITFDAPEEKAIEKHCEKTSIFPFPTMFSIGPDTNFNFRLMNLAFYKCLQFGQAHNFVLW